MSPRWPAQEGPTPREAAALQLEWRERVVRRAELPRLARVAGVDVCERGAHARAAACVYDYDTLELLEEATAELPVLFPYVPGLLGFREVPALRAAIERLSTRPDLLLVDGHGLAHPRRFGVACHIGLELDLPSIGCGKSILVGEHGPLGPERGVRAGLKDGRETIGCALRTRVGVKPLYVSIGHRVDLRTALRVALHCTQRYRLPEPIRRADWLAGQSR